VQAADSNAHKRGMSPVSEQYRVFTAGDDSAVRDPEAPSAGSVGVDTPAVGVGTGTGTPAVEGPGPGQGLTLVHFPAQLERFVWDRGCA
jgi:hypothetical protein